MISETQKKQITTALKNYIVGFPSQKKAVETLDGVSEATVIAVVQGKWSSISNEMWLNLRSQLEVDRRMPNIVETLNFQTLILYFSLAKEEGASFSIIARAGSGKTLAGKWYARANRSNNVYYLECAQYWNKKQFLSKLLVQMGKHVYGMNVSDMMDTITRELRRQHQPVIILDEIDKLNEAVLLFFITLYNELNSLCGFVWTSTNNIEKRIKRGLDTNKMGYQELFSRIGSKYIELREPNREEIIEICKANGIRDEEEAAMIANECDGDLRRVERHFLKQRAKQMRKDKSLKAA